ncbi:hypothetical protein PoMZ_11386 [Pyricularia oryzae]|uniref:Uncharacterized protein n=1 Tax=Pyricularia oryzae TaxID=318829 RepID=A0A4P7NK89_PYROR|nr:hypothetical protein PoMZ_11386 [Pyricularia oryzae]
MDTPDAPACHSTLSPLANPPTRCSACVAVMKVSGMPAACSWVSPAGLCMSMRALTAMYSAPKTASPFLKGMPSASVDAEAEKSPNDSITPLNSTPSVLGACGGSGYLPSRCRRSIRFSPKAETLTRTWPAPGVGLGVSALMNRADAGPAPPRTSLGGECELRSAGL